MQRFPNITVIINNVKSQLRIKMRFMILNIFKIVIEKFHNIA